MELCNKPCIAWILSTPIKLLFGPPRSEKQLWRIWKRDTLVEILFFARNHPYIPASLVGVISFRVEWIPLEGYCTCRLGLPAGNLAQIYASLSLYLLLFWATYEKSGRI
jgi:hypothetical protein